MRPPVVARVILALAAGPSAAFVLGDLEEEFQEQTGGRAWYWQQVFGSLVPMLKMRVRSQELPVAVLTGAVPLVLLDQLWRVVYSMIPLKDGTDRAAGYFIANLVVLAVCVRLQPRVNVLTACSVAGALLLSSATLPWWYIFLALGLAIIPRRLA